MARVTVEDCVDKVPNRFELVMLAAHRAREIQPARRITIDRDNDKNPVVALREIADETQQADELRERMIESHQTQIEVDEPEEDQMALLMGGEMDRPMVRRHVGRKAAARPDGSAGRELRPDRGPAGGAVMIDVEDLIALVRNYNPRMQCRADPPGLCLWHEDARRPDAQVGRALFHPSRRRRRDPDRTAAG